MKNVMLRATYSFPDKQQTGRPMLWACRFQYSGCSHTAAYSAAVSSACVVSGAGWLVFSSVSS